MFNKRNDQPKINIKEVTVQLDCKNHLSSYNQMTSATIVKTYKGCSSSLLNEQRKLLAHTNHNKSYGQKLYYSG